jgi:hypothetical protein
MTKEEAKLFIVQSVKDNVDIAKLADAINVLEQSDIDWIFVNEKLPPDKEQVIVMCLDDSGDTYSYVTSTACRFMGGWLSNDVQYMPVVAWKPLPNPLIFKEVKE